MAAQEKVAEISDDSSEDELNENENNNNSSPELLLEKKGILSKWTNYIHGWQDRYVCCTNGTLCYYRNEDESEYGCRGTISLSKACIHKHEFDSCRFDVTINDSVWYLRATSEDERNHWCEIIEENKTRAQASHNGETTSINSGLRRQGSLMSINSNTVSVNSSGSSLNRQTTRILKEKLAELDTFKDILNNKIESLQRFFDRCADVHDNGVTNTAGKGDSLEDKISQSTVVDFRGEAITFKATTSGTLQTLQHCIEVMQMREEKLLKKIEKERERRRRMIEKHESELRQARRQVSLMGNPDLEEGPNSEMTEEMFYECLEAYHDKQDRVDEDMRVSKNLQKKAVHEKPKQRHEHSDKLEQRIKSHLTESMALPEEGDENSWELFAEEGELKVYRRELVIDDRICDPLKAIHSIGLVTAREMCHYFWDTSYRLEWEGTIDSFRVIEAPAELTTIIYQTHKRVWPSAQRDCLYISNMLQVDDQPMPKDGRKPHDTWMVCNFSVEHDKAEPVSGCCRAECDIALICQTYVIPPPNGGKITRENLRCDIVYVAEVNPGGWAPASVLRTIYKREYPKFLRKFTAYVQEKTKDKEIWF